MQSEEPSDLQSLPEGCISNVLSLTSPRDACRLSLVSPIFKRAGESDAVWERFLPSDYEAIISRSTTPVPPLSKKDLYFFLCDHPILIDGGTKSFVLDKCTGKKIYMVGARDLTIIWGRSPEYWRWTALPDSRFAEVAELLSVCWLEIIGKIESRMLSPKTIYKAYLVIKLGDRVYGLQRLPADVSVSIGGIESGSGSPVYLCPEDDDYFTHLRRRSRPRLEGQFPKDREDGWMEIELCEFFNDEGDGEVMVTVKETKGGHWKGGLIVQGIELRPN